ncbi:hypothetical protein ACJ73_09783 [Blastomyces percursus]|uniref:CCHC-type domain-containing protein n=1 Tax=Blastomyces percursus TaxID=1658174 RepID=A0A1J9P3K8_9EURO|nr:hypothetical protein ACJ73_09783 [Blastomyces percursus]
MDFRRLVMRNGDVYAQFLTRFLHLAGESQLPKEDFKDEFFNKLSYDLQKMMTDAYITCATFKEFQERCNRAAYTLERQKPRMPKKTEDPKPNLNAADNRFNASGHRLYVPNTGNSTNQPSDAERQELMRMGKCYFCKEHGHISRNCPRKKRNTEIKQLEHAVEDDKDTEELKDLA